MIGKVQQDSFPSLRIRIEEYEKYDQYEPSLSASSGYGSPAASPGESLLPRDCHESLLHGYLASATSSSGLQTSSPHHHHNHHHDSSSSSSSSTSSYSSSASSSPNSCGKLACELQQQQQQQQQPSSRYKTEMCRPFQEHGECKYGEKCQFAHGGQELRTVNRHPKYKTDMCRTYHSVGFCPYGPRCHFIHALDELRQPPPTPEKKSANGGANSNGAPVKQLPMFGGGRGGGGGGGPASSSSNTTWSFPDTAMHSDMRSAVSQLNNFFNVSAAANAGGCRQNAAGAPGSVTSSSSRSGSFCSDLDSPSSTSPPPPSSSVALQHNNNNNNTSDSAELLRLRAPRLPIFSRLA